MKVLGGIFAVVGLVISVVGAVILHNGLGAVLGCGIAVTGICMVMGD